MKKILVITSALMLCAVLVLAAGCTQPEKTTGTPTPTMAVTSAAATPSASSTAVFSTPGPTQTLPPTGISRFRSKVTVMLRIPDNHYRPGRSGLTFIQQIDVKVTRTDGIVETGIIPKPLKVGDFVSLSGTDKNHDRAEVWATDPQGTKVKIFDDYIPFRTYN